MAINRYEHPWRRCHSSEQSLVPMFHLFINFSDVYYLNNHQFAILSPNDNIDMYCYLLSQKLTFVSLPHYIMFMFSVDS